MSPTYKVIDGPGWQWAEDYVYVTATYVVACPPNRTCQVGMGLFAFGEPRGEKIRFSGEREITVVGAGALHFRVDDGKGPCKVGFVQKSNRLISWTWEV
ncbi:hypothetical protein [Hyphomicrobium sp.]|uniref:hypothetical protein n=1 Tax=Hyphomicrobium sp. TaxID=82 RepID=UPI002FE0DD9D